MASNSTNPVDAPHRFNVAGQAQVVWLEPGLSPIQAARAAAIKLQREVSTSEPSGGWPRLTDLCASTPVPADWKDAK